MFDEGLIEELPVRKQYGAIGMLVMTACVVLPSTLAAYNLVNGTGIIPSLIWLAFISLTLFCSIQNQGFWVFITEFIGAFARRHFVRTIRIPGKGIEMQIGYQIGKSRFFYITTPLSSITLVKWSTGQASDRVGQDMDDWAVAIWFDVDPAKSRKRSIGSRPDQDLCIVGVSGRKAEVEAFGHVLVDFLRRSGAQLVQGKNECTFVRRTSEVGTP